MAQPQRTQRDALDRALELAGIDIFADAESVVGDEEDAGDDILHQRLRAEGKRQTQHAEARQQRRDVDAERRENDEAGDSKDGAEDEVADERQDGRQPACLMNHRLVLAVAGHGDAGRRREGFEAPPEEAADHPGGHDRKADALENDDPADGGGGVVLDHDRAPELDDDMQADQPGGAGKRRLDAA
ncbi:hypothetical protein D9M72_408350 [compost metagenome]